MAGNRREGHVKREHVGICLLHSRKAGTQHQRNPRELLRTKSPKKRALGEGTPGSVSECWANPQPFGFPGKGNQGLVKAGAFTGAPHSGSGPRGPRGKAL